MRRWQRGVRADRVLPALSAIRRADHGDRQRSGVPTLQKLRWQPAIRTVPAYYEHPGLYRGAGQSVDEGTAGLEARRRAGRLLSRPAAELFQEGRSLSLPVPEDLAPAARAAGLGAGVCNHLPVAFGPEEWLQPYTVEHVAELARRAQARSRSWRRASRRIASRRWRRSTRRSSEAFEEAGGEHSTYIPCLNDDDDHIDMLTDVICNEAKGWLE